MAAEIIPVDVPEKTWTKVATGVVTGFLEIPENMGQFSFYMTYRATGSAAPLDSDLRDGYKRKKLFVDSVQEPIQSTSPIDIYITSQDSDKSTNKTAVINVAAS